MGRRSAMNMKMELPTVSWMAIMRLLKKAPSGVLGIDAAAKALLGCSALPTTPSFRYTDNPSPVRRFGSGRGSSRRPKPAAAAALLPLMGCAARPHTDSFRIHHVVNQEALQLVLALDEQEAAAAEEEEEQHNPTAFRRSDPLQEAPEPMIDCSLDAIIRDGDRLLRDEVHGSEASSASLMSACSSRLSNDTAGSSCSGLSAAHTAFTHNSAAESEECQCSYSTASSASFVLTPRHPDQYNSASCCSSPVYYRSATSARSAGNSQLSAAAEDACRSHDGHHDNEDVDHACHSHDGHDDDDDDVDPYHSNNGDDDDVDDDECGVIAETCFSDNPLQDFEESMEELISCRALVGRPDELHALYCRYIELNPPALHPTIAVAFFHTLQRLSPAAHKLAPSL